MRKKQLSEKCLVLQIVICDGEIMFVCNIYSAWHAAAGLLVESQVCTFTLPWLGSAR